ncbi:MAG: hypothetical protein PHQ27_00830 [Victivallales bacterium]|nr:hypothetical protein [Victivallales bacterium]
MGIADLFKPRWRHHDEKIRAEAVKKLTKEAILRELALHDPAPRVRATAAGKLTDLDLVRQIVRNRREDSAVRKAAMSRLEDKPDAMLQLAVESLDLATFRAVAEFFPGQDALAGIAVAAQDREVALEASSRIVNQKLLEQVIHQSPDPQVRADAVSRLHDQKFLMGLARNEADEPVRLKAVEKLTDMTVLAEIAAGDSSPAVRAAAYQRLRDPDQLARGLEDPEEIVRLAALRKIRDPQVMARVAVDDSSKTVRKDAVKRLVGDEFLLQVVKESSDPDIRYIAVGRMSTNEELIIGNIMTDPDPELRKVGLTHLRTSAAIINVVIDDPDIELRFMALNRLTDPEDLALVLERSDGLFIRAAVRIRQGDCGPFFELLSRLDAENRELLLRLLDYDCLAHVIHAAPDPKSLELMMHVFQEGFCARHIHITEDDNTCSCMVCGAHVNDFLENSRCVRCGMTMTADDIRPGWYFFAVTDAGTELVGICLECGASGEIVAEVDGESFALKPGNIKRIISFREYEELREKLWQANLVLST